MNKSSKGFSIIEIMTVIAITSIIGLVIFTIGSKSGATHDVEGVSQQIAAQIRALQGESLAGKKIGNNIICRFSFDSAIDSYTISYDKECSGAANIIDTTNFNVSNKRVNLSTAVITFTSPRGEMTNGQTQIVVTSNKDASVKWYVYINAQGNMEISKTPLM